MSDYLTLTELGGAGYTPADLPPPYLTGLDGGPCWERSTLDHLLGPPDED